MGKSILPDKGLPQRLATHRQYVDEYTGANQQIENSLNKFCSALQEMSKEELLIAQDLVMAKLKSDTLHPVFCQYMLEEIRKKLTRLNP